MVIAIDGPAGAGKSSVARAVAERLGFTYLDTGAMYRAVALAARERERPPAEVAEEIAIEVGERIRIDGRDVTQGIRTREVSELASRVSEDPGVRAALVRKQQEILREGDWVAEGRDVGTVVAPHAELKVFLTASPEVRARRRAAELGTDVETVLKDQVLRDQRDSQRAHAPLVAADDAVELDTTSHGLEQVVERIAELAESRRASG
jgi:cytidylate kinase